MNEMLWFTSRATGIVAVVLLTAVFVLGLLTAGSERRAGDRTAVIMGLHRALSLGMSVFLTAHVATAIGESYVDLGWISAFVPFTSGFAPLLVSLGTLAVDILLAVIVTSILRQRLSDRTWRRVHLCSYALLPMAVIHGIGLGTSDEPVLRAISVACGVVGIGALVWRRGRRDHHQSRRRQIAEQGWS